MKTQHQHSQPEPPRAAPPKGAPATFAAYAVRRDVSVRVAVMAPPEPDELREPGYGHGV
jgi:hypothetical protein